MLPKTDWVLHQSLNLVGNTPSVLINKLSVLFCVFVAAAQTQFIKMVYSAILCSGF